MVYSAARIRAFLIGLILLLCLSIQAQDSIRHSSPQLWLGLEAPGTLVYPFKGGISVQPAAFIRLQDAWTLWAGAGYVAYPSDTVFRNVYEYKSSGYYIKSGADLHITAKHQQMMRLVVGGGLTYSRFSEKGVVRLQYAAGRFHTDNYQGAPYEHTLSQAGWTAAVELRQGFFIEIGKLGIQLLVHESFIMRRPPQENFPVHYAPGVGIYSPNDKFFGNPNVSYRRIVPSATAYLFYRIYKG